MDNIRSGFNYAIYAIQRPSSRFTLKLSSAWNFFFSYFLEVILKIMVIKEVKTRFLNRFPACYRNFYVEWRHGKAAPVHQILEEGEWKRIPETGHV